MLPLGMVLGFVSYGVGSWGWILTKGYNITLREWFSPLHPFTGALSSNGMVPQGSIFPTSGKGSTPTGQALSPIQQQQRQNLAGAAPNPHGTVQ